ncbi:MAG: glycoside hydrolase family 36 protein [Bryobacteraceae bacterium]
MKPTPVLLTLVAAIPPLWAQAVNPWSFTLDKEHAFVSIRHSGTGPLLDHISLHVKQGNKLERLNKWSLARGADDEIIVHTEQPRTGWRFAMEAGVLRISCTAANGVITAAIPAGNKRMPVRLMDAEGTPVDWVGTNEVADGYGGSETHNQSYLPRRNSEVMYFALGAVSSPVFHSLFDRETDTAIDFPQGTVLKGTGGDPEGFEAAIPIEGNATVRVVPDYFTKVLGVPYYVPFDDSYFRSAPMVWSSWTSYYGAVREEDMVRNADWLAAHLKPYGFEYVQLDDGYDRDSKGQHYWIEKWDREKFPHGPQWLTQHIREKGLRAGLWLVPNAYAGAVEQHPDWYLRNKQGNIILDYHTPSLDSTNPDVLELVKHIFQTLDDWGFDYYKFDGEHAIAKYVPGADRSRLHAPSADLLENYRLRLKEIREVLGPHRFIEGCPAGTPLNGIGFFNSYFTGHDLYNNFQGMYPLFSSINANAFLNHVVVYVMPGEGLELGLPMTVEEAMKKRPREVVDTARTREQPLTGFGTTLAEARTLVTYVALTGVAYPLASVMPELPEERVNLLKVTMPTLPILPADLFSRGTDMQWDIFKHVQSDFYFHNYPEILDLKVDRPGGKYDIIGLTNWRGEPARRQVDLEGKLGLDPHRRYAAFDFWKQELVGIVSGKLDIEIQPHETRVLWMRPVSDRPEFLGTSRHITGTYGISNVSWDAASQKLSGTAVTVAGDPDTVWAYIPNGMKLAGVRVLRNGGSQIAAQQGGSKNLASLSFSGQDQPVTWEMQFAAAPGR